MALTTVRYRDYSGRLQVSDIPDLLKTAEENPWFPIPYPILKSMLDDEYAEKPYPESVGVTRLISGCLRCGILQKNVDYMEDLSSLWSRWRGSMYHYVLQHYHAPGDIVEPLMFAPIGDHMLVGRIDLIRPKQRTLIDFKTTKQVPMWDRIWEDNNKQIQINRWLANHAIDLVSDQQVSLKDIKEIKFESVGIWYADDQGVKPLEARVALDVPTTSKGAKNKYKKIKLPDLWSDEKVEEFLLPKISNYIASMLEYKETGVLPPYPEGVNPSPSLFWPHRFSPTTDLCLSSYYANL